MLAEAEDARLMNHYANWVPAGPELLDPAGPNQIGLERERAREKGGGVVTDSDRNDKRRCAPLSEPQQVLPGCGGITGL